MIYNPQNSTFGVLYDFSAEQGDWVGCSICPSSFQIDSLGRVPFMLDTLEVQHTHLMSFTYMTYEKIGNTGFLIPHMQNMTPSDAGIHLRCYYDNEGLYLHTGESESCDDGNEVHDKTSIQLLVAPHAISVISESIEIGSEISVYDLRGRLVAREIAEQITTCYVEMHSGSRAGYFVIIRNSDEYFSQKFILVNTWY
jgi:hypothetical protein